MSMSTPTASDSQIRALLEIPGKHPIKYMGHQKSHNVTVSAAAVLKSALTNSRVMNMAVVITTPVPKDAKRSFVRAILWISIAVQQG